MEKSRRMRWVGHIAHMGEMRNAYKIMVGKPKGKKPFGRRRHKWENNVRWILEEKGEKVRTGCIWLRTRTNGKLL
jgi:hypothetical protein